jgi:putative membrane protein insertion efficiency factor
VKEAVHPIQRAFRHIAAAPIRIYRAVISPLLPRLCRYHHSCSQYGLDSIMRHGVFRGGAMAIARIFRCWGWFSGGNDPVPERWSWSALREGYRNFYAGPGSAANAAASEAVEGNVEEKKED